MSEPKVPSYPKGTSEPSWKSELDERQIQELELARLYVRDFCHGTTGHQRLVLIDKLASILEVLGGGGQPAPDKPLAFTLLDVPYHSQHEADAQWFRKDCGPACIEMVGEYLQPTNTAVTTNEIMQFITHGVDKSIYISELQRAFEHFYTDPAGSTGGGILDRNDGASWENLKTWIDAGKPCIVLVHYGSFGMRMDRNWTAGHYMVVCGHDKVDYQGTLVERAICHDPDFYGNLMSQGAFIPITRDHFMGMWEDCYKDQNPRRMALVPRGPSTG